MRFETVNLAIQGPVGSTGPEGPEGPAGPIGPQGPVGPQGEGLEVKGSVPDVESLPDDATPGDVWVVTSFDPDHLFIWDGTAWVDLGEGGGGTVTQYQTRTAAIAASIPINVNEIVTLSYATPGDGGGAQHRRVVSEPTHLGKFQSADGAWWELVAFPEVTLEMFGGKADGQANVTPPAAQPGTDNWPAFQAAFGYARSILYNVQQSSASIRLLRGVYAVSQTLVIDQSVRISGSGATPILNAYSESILVFPPNTTAFKCWSHNSPDPPPGGPPHNRSAMGALLENIRIHSFGGTLVALPVGFVPDLTAHGIIMHTVVVLKHITLQNFAGNGLHITASETTAGPGSANEIDLYGVRCFGSGGHGVFISGGDTNAGSGVRMDTSNSGGFGLWDSSFLGNTWTGCHSSANGIKSRSHHLGKHYLYKYPTAGNTAEPGTNTAVWEYYEDGGPTFFYPEWSASVVYLPGGAYSTMKEMPEPPAIADAIGTVFLGCYAEGGQGKTRLSSGTMYIGGTHASPFDDRGQIIAWNGVLSKWGVNMKMLNKPDPGMSMMLAPTDFDPIAIFANGDATSGFKIGRWDTLTNTYKMVHGATDDSGTSMMFPTTVTKAAVSAGRGSALLSGNVVFPHDIFVGPNVASVRMISNSAVIPSIGPEYAQGDLVFNSQPTSGEPVGWICTQGGIVATTSAWLTANDYAAGTYVKTAAGRFYRCKYDPAAGRSLVEPTHTLNAVLADGYGWIYIDDLVSSNPVWTSGTNYAVNDLVKISGTEHVYKCVTDPGATASTVSPATTDVATYTDGASGAGYQWQFLCHYATVPDWVLNTVYPIGSLIKTTTGFVYRCIISSGPSTQAPFHLFVHGDYVPLADGYQWDFVLAYPQDKWQFGTTYPVTFEHSRIVNRNGDTYNVRAKPATSILSSEEPTHLGVQAAADGYSWTYVEEGGTLDNLWVSGTNYALNALVTSLDTFSIYKCTVDPGGAVPSTVPPTLVSASDWHLWKFMSSTSPIWKTWGVVDPVADVDSLDTLTAPSGGTITQSTSKANTVVLNKICGQITTHNASLAAATAVSFTLTNSKIAAPDVIQTSIVSGATAGAYDLIVDAVAAGSCRITLYNRTAAPLGEAIVINFAILKGSLS